MENTAEISTQALSGKVFTPIAIRVCFPDSPNISTIKSDAALIIAG
jgi:hypothetical protein